MQIRVLDWQQMADKDDYSTQGAVVIASPPSDLDLPRQNPAYSPNQTIGTLSRLRACLFRIYR